MAKQSFLMSEAEQSSNSPNKTLIERAYAQLRSDIVDGRLAPGEKLRVEHLKESYGVGAGTLREAITRLVSDALIEAEGQRGFKVAAVSLSDLEDLTRLRLHIEIDALRQSIRNADDAWRFNLQKSFEEVSAIEQPIQANKIQEWESKNNQFHLALISAGASPWTLRFLSILARHGERYRRYAFGLPNIIRDVHAEHIEIFEYAMSGNESRAALALESHITNTPEAIKAAIKNGLEVFKTGQNNSVILHLLPEKQNSELLIE